MAETTSPDPLTKAVAALRACIERSSLLPLPETPQDGSRPACGRPASDYRMAWAFGMTRAERHATWRCRRPAGHRGLCLSHPNTPPAPLRPIRTQLRPHGAFHLH